jgi:hypothetical protein
MRMSRRHVATLAVALAPVLGACTSASGVDRAAVLDPTACEIDPDEEFDMPMPDVGAWMAGPTSWALIESVAVREPAVVALTADLAAGLHQHTDRGDRVLLGTGESRWHQQAIALPGDAPAAGGPLELWLIDNRTWPDPERHLLATIDVEPSTVWAYVDIAGAEIDDVIADPSTAVTVRLSDRFERDP